MKKRLLLLSLVVLGSLVIFSGCGKDGKTTAAPGAGDKGEPIKVGVISAWDFEGGQGAKRGAQMAIDEINASGGLLGRQLMGVYVDNKANPEEAKKATQRLLDVDKVDVISGFWRSDLAIACQPDIMKAKKILLIGGATTPVITHQRITEDYNTNKYTFTTFYNTLVLNDMFSQQIKIAQNKFGVRKIAMVVEKAAWCDPLYDAYCKDFANDIVYKTRVSTTQTDFSVEYTKAKEAGAEILFFVGTGTNCLPSVIQWHDMKLPMVYLSYNVALQGTNAWTLTEGKCNATSVNGPLYNLPITKKTLEWTDRYKQKFGEEPVAYTNAGAYDGIMLWAEAVKAAGTIESDAVVKTMEERDFNYVGPIWNIKGFDKIHNPEGQIWPLAQWQNGKQECIWPEESKTADMILPDVMKK